MNLESIRPKRFCLVSQCLSAIVPLCFILLFSCTQPQNNLDLLLSYMSGSFSSQEQARADTNFSDIRLEMVHIWKNQMGGYWLYVEQAAADQIDKPYRQRVYQLTQVNDSTFKSSVYNIPDPEKYIGEWKNKNPLAGLTPDSLKEKEGCAVILNRQGKNAFVGMSESLKCESDHRGADFATSIVLLTKDMLYTWDRGFNMEGDQVWGATLGGYMFKKIR
jgi:CpeT protein